MHQLQFLNLPTASSNHAGGAIVSLYDNFQPANFVTFLLKIVRNCSPSMQAAKSLSNDIYLFIISLCLLREVLIRFISFSIFRFFFENFD